MAQNSEQAINLLEGRIRSNTRTLAFSRLADAYRKGGRIKEAIELCEDGLKYHPDNITGHIIMGRCYLEQENTEKAIAEFTAVCMTDRRNHLAIKMLADIFAKKAMTEKAGDLYRILLSMDPGNASLSQLCQHFAGAGKISVYDVLNIAPRVSPAPDATRAPAPTSSFEPEKTVVDFEELLLSKTPHTETPPSADIFVDETVEDTTFNPEDTVTGEDIGHRMALMFDEDDAPVATGPDHTVIMDPAIADTVIGPSPFADKATIPEGSAASGTVLSSDISSRIEQLFGMDKGPEATHDKPTSEFQLEDVLSEDMQTSEISIDKPVDSKPAAINEASFISPEPAAAASGSLQDVLKDDTEEHDVDFAPQIPERSDKIAPAGGSAELSLEATRADDLEPFLIPPQKTSLLGKDGQDELFDISESSTQFAPSSDTKPAPDEELLSPVSSVNDVPFTLASSDLLEKTIVDDSLTNAVMLAKNSEIMSGPFMSPEQETIELQSPTATGAAPALEGPEEIILQAPAQQQPVQSDDESVTPSIDHVEGLGAVSGNDVTLRLDEIFSDTLASSAGATATADALPDEEPDTTINPGFYTVSGQDAGSAPVDSDTLGKMEDEEQIEALDSMTETTVDNTHSHTISFDVTGATQELPVFSDVPDSSDEQTKEITLEETQSGADDTAASMHDLDMFTDDTKEIGVYHDELQHDAERAVPVMQNEPTDFSDEEIDNGPKESASDGDNMVSGDEVTQRLSEIFPDETLQGQHLSVDALPDEEPTVIGTGFYSVSGDDAQSTTADNGLLDTIDNVEMGPADTLSTMDDEPPLSAQDTVVLSSDQQYDVYQGPQPTAPPAFAAPQYDVSDQVITPTLADIYFAQGQYSMALQVYERLLVRDERNVRYVKIIDELKRLIADRATMEKLEQPARLPVQKGSSLLSKKRNITAKTLKPLSGVKINKKARPKKSKGQ